MLWCTGIILVVDGYDGASNSATEALADTDYIILHANTAQEAESMLFRLKHVVDLVVIDLELPNETGHGIVELLTNIRRREASRIIAQTSRQDESFLGSVSRLGVDAILLKPTSAKQLAGTVHAMLA